MIKNFIKIFIKGIYKIYLPMKYFVFRMFYRLYIVHCNFLRLSIIKGSFSYRFITIETQDRSFNMILERPGHLEDEIISSKKWEPHITSIISCFMSKEKSVFLDVGANIGYHSLYIASSFKNSQCISFEPNPFVYNQLIRNINLNSIVNIFAYSLAIGDQCGYVKFCSQNKTSYNRGLSSIQQNADLGDNYNKIKVEITTIDKFLEDNTKDDVSVMKIDTQGHEYQILLGAVKTIRKCKPVIIFEFESNYHDNPDKTMRDIINLLSDYNIYQIMNDSPEVYTFNISSVSKKGFASDLLCLPKKYINDPEVINESRY
ncbi:MAG: FkbM family methyltransferase [Gammaproteobacteria bacterium]|nr:FkbM family methyltransferase [Gammaproteobacteria bacterium]